MPSKGFIFGLILQRLRVYLEDKGILPKNSIKAEFDYKLPIIIVCILSVITVIFAAFILYYAD